MIEIKNLTKKYGEKIALNNASFSVEKGKICAFIGKNGAGKTTAIKCLTGIIDFDEGDITINSLSIKTHAQECKQQLAYIPDNPDLYEFMTGIGYLNFICDVFKIDKEKRKQQIEKYSVMFDLFNNLNQPIASYSHGMKQKIALISALVHEPKLLVLDEPFVGLDPNSTHKLKELMKTMTQNGCTVFFSTHILEVAEKLCDHLVIVSDGQIVKQGNMKDIIGDASLEKLFLELNANE